MAYVPDNEDRTWVAPPVAELQGQGQVQWIWSHEKPKRMRKKQPFGFAAPRKGRKK